ncbi:MAG: MazG-like family protein [Jatrophihabitans sp.]|uniref:MazG-like family protein n=1 Tax=Jatrophihabitans sp. TaxID=1932789 RepID=UPI003F7E29AC
MTTVPTDADLLVALSMWIDDGNAHRGTEARTWGRLAKVAEECGEVIQAYIGATGQNPRKGVTNDTSLVVKELLDVALTALAAVEHLDGHRGNAMDALASHIDWVAARAGLVDGCPGDDGCPGAECERCSSGRFVLMCADCRSYAMEDAR